MYISLFISAFLAATILPAQSEAVLAYQISAAPDKIVMLIAIATFGNVLGAVVNWGLGMFATRYRDRAWFPVGRDKLEKAEGRYRKFGRYSLLLSWVPFIGDPITGRRCVAGTALVVSGPCHHRQVIPLHHHFHAGDGRHLMTMDAADS